MKRVVLISGLVALVLSIGIVTLQRTDVSKNYEQTWPKLYSETTCSEWREDMDPDQKFATAGDFLWEDLKRNGATERPDYGPITAYRDAIDQSCDARRGWTLARVSDDIGLAD